MRKLTFLTTPILLLAAATAAAQSIEETEAWQKQDEYMKRSLEIYSMQCGSKLDFKFDKSTWWAKKSEWSKSSPNGLCSQAVEALANTCASSAAAKKAISSKLRWMNCGHGKFAQSISAGVGYRLILNGDVANLGDEVQAFIKKSL
jgi:hypothetical protein